VQPPEFYEFEPPGDQVRQYQLFTFKEKRQEQQKQGIKGGPPPVARSSAFRILGVVKTDTLYLVLRFTSGNKIRLVAEGNVIIGGLKVKSLSPGRAVIIDANGGERIYKVFQLEPQTVFKKFKGVVKKKQ
jgi:hypothetical protein